METSQNILKERAQQLASPLSKKEICDGNCGILLSFELAGRSYGIDSSFVKEILNIEELVSIPGLPPYFAGIINVRSKIISIIHLKILLQIEQDQKKSNQVIVLQDKITGLEFGFLADKIINTIPLIQSDVKDLPINLSSDARVYLKGITEKGLIVINTKQLINSTHLIQSQS